MAAEYECNHETQKDIKYVQDTLYVISGKWKMLSKELKEMEMNKLVSRIVEPGPPRSIDYTLTEYCKTLYPILEEMIYWAKHHRTII